ncbi:MAG: heavy-metal-associated domain-containing protein [Flavobacteriales bacterium]|nr:heavy-metal-associated domain-containing protein [Flavobacteriales bacterium]MBL6872596.1 heavy-metal-associated domain-containing protein [Flavobacteriales bacterium]
MFKNFLTLLSILVLVSCGQNTTSNVESEVMALADAKAEFIIDGMSCQVGCAAYIDEELEKLEGVVKAEVDFESKLAVVDYDNSLISEYAMIDLINTLKDSLYTVSSVEVEILQAVEQVKIDTH